MASTLFAGWLGLLAATCGERIDPGCVRSAYRCGTTCREIAETTLSGLLLRLSLMAHWKKWMQAILRGFSAFVVTSHESFGIWWCIILCSSVHFCFSFSRCTLCRSRSFPASGPGGVEDCRARASAVSELWMTGPEHQQKQGTDSLFLSFFICFL
jgi:hypothetical protein